MAILGIGTDVVDVRRIAALQQRHPRRFPERILCADELAVFESVAAPRRAAFLAKRFASKEALSKALGTGFRDGLRFADVEVCHDPLGKPMLRLHRRAEALARSLGVTALHLSIADETDTAVAFVVAEKAL